MLQIVIFGFDEKIKAYLDAYAKEHAEFKTKYESKEKTIFGCCKYITDVVRKCVEAANAAQGQTKGVGQIEDDVVYNMAVQYFMDDAIKEEKPKPIAPPAPKTDATTKDTGKKKASDKFKKKETAKETPKKETKETAKAETKTEQNVSTENGEQKFIQLALF